MISGTDNERNKKMKKIVLTFAAIMAVSVSFAGNDNNVNSNGEKATVVAAANMEQNYDMSVDYERLAGVLSLNEFQAEAVELVHNQFIKDMKAVESAQPSLREELVEKALDKELQHMSYVLNKKQLEKFTQLVSLTLANRGLLVK